MRNENMIFKIAERFCTSQHKWKSNLEQKHVATIGMGENKTFKWAILLLTLVKHHWGKIHF